MGSSRGATLQFSRKQAGELLGDLDEAERQIAKYYDMATENYQIVEGIISPIPMFKKKVDRMVLPPRYGRVMYSYSVTDAGYLHGEKDWAVSPAMYWAWIQGLNRCGVTTLFTVNWQDTAQMLSAIYNNEAKPAESHTTLQRVYKPRIVIKKKSSIVQALMFLSHVYKLGIGEERASAIEDYGFFTLASIFNASVDDLAHAGFGKPSAIKLLNALGRTDV